ncbi:hypothetical protein [[Pseudomonas] boreopolis]|uniref:hypothetical protein n=1 Tax=Xanthomonas boreopolis TaxID=86183 RepID=UPI003D9B3615
MSANHENDLSLGRRYKKYEGAYNLAFAADPDIHLRRFDEMAPKDDLQWKRLEVFRGNDREAYHAHKSNPNDALVRPTEKEQRMWEANQNDMWRIDREPSYGQHGMTNNKWFDLSLEQRRADNTQKFFHAAEQRYGGDYEAWAAKAGTKVVAKEDYLQTRAALEIEQRQAAQQQKLKEAQVQVQAQPAQQAPAAHQAAPAQSTPQASPDAQEQAAPAEAPRRTRLSLMNFATPEDGIAQLHEEMSQLPAEQVKQRAEQAEGEHQAMGKGRTEEAATRVAALNAYHAQVQEVQQQERTQRQETPAQVETQRRTYQQ